MNARDIGGNDNGEVLFECEHCGRIFAGELFVVTKALQRIEFHSGGCEAVADVSYAEGVANFCSEVCLQTKLKEVMERQMITGPLFPPGARLYETCARCEKPILTSELHWVFYREHEIWLKSGAVQPINAQTLAATHRKCLDEFAVQTAQQILAEA